MAVLGAFAGGIEYSAAERWQVYLALVVLVAVVGFFVDQGRALRRFAMQSARLWVTSERP